MFRRCVSAQRDGTRLTPLPGWLIVDDHAFLRESFARSPPLITPFEKGQHMPTRFFVAILYALLTGSLLSPVALAADGPATENKPSKDTKPKVHATLQVHAVAPTIWPGADKKFDGAEFALYKQNLAAWVKSPVVLNKALADRSISHLPLVKQHEADLNGWLADQLMVESPKDTELVTISMKADDRQQTAEIVNSVVVAFLKEVVDTQRTDKLIRRDNLDKKFRAYKMQLLEKERQKYELDQQLLTPRRSAIVQIQRQIADVQQLTLEARRAAIQAELKTVLANKRAESKAAAAAEIKSARDEIDSAHTEQEFWETKVAKLATEAAKLDDELERTQKFTGDVDQLQSEIDQLKTVIRDMGEALTRCNIELDAEPRVRLLETAN